MQAITDTIQKLLKEFDELKVVYSVAELKLLKEIEELKLSNKKLKKNIQKLQNEFGLTICEFFHNCNSIRETAKMYYFEDVRDCYEALVDYNGCSDPLYDADDFRDCYKEIFGKEYSENDKNEENTLIIEDFNPEIRSACVSCQYIDNLEEGTECNKCGRWVCQQCASFKDDGNYYCVVCSVL